MKNNIKVDENSTKILVIGCNGFLGSTFFNLKNNEYLIDKKIHLIASSLHDSILDEKFDFYKIDITNEKVTIKTVIKISPDIIILTAAMTDVDQCEVNKNLATQINVIGPKNVIKACEEGNSKLVFISTDFVFGGKKEGGYYSENDSPNPLSHYAKTKYEAELAILNSRIDFLICRTAVLYGWNEIKLNFITWILKNLKQNNEISIVVNQINSPTLVPNLAQIILKLIEKDAVGIYHTAGDCALSRYEMALNCAEIFNFDKELIKPLNHITQNAIRPKNVSLNINKLKSVLGSELKIYNLKEGLSYMKQNPI